MLEYSIHCRCILGRRQNQKHSPICMHASQKQEQVAKFVVCSLYLVSSYVMLAEVTQNRPTIAN